MKFIRKSRINLYLPIYKIFCFLLLFSSEIMKYRTASRINRGFKNMFTFTVNYSAYNGIFVENQFCIQLSQRFCFDHSNIVSLDFSSSWNSIYWSKECSAIKVRIFSHSKHDAKYCLLTFYLHRHFCSKFVNLQYFIEVLILPCFDRISVALYGGLQLAGSYLAILFPSKSWGGASLFTMIESFYTSWGSRKTI